MKLAPWMMCGLLGLGCSADPASAGFGGAPANNGGSAGAVNEGGNAGVLATGGGGAGGLPGTAGSQAAAGTSSSAGNGGSPGTASGGSGGSAGSAGTSSGGVGGASGCVPDAGGVLSVVGETVHDAKSCLDWMKTTKAGVNYAAAEMFCGDSTLGGFDDWRIPTASEFASTVTLCGKYPPEGPIDTKFFDQQGDGYWTSTPAGEPNKVCAVGMLNAGGYYHYGTAGPQVVRCVRGSGSVKTVKDCIAAMGCMSW